MANLHMLFGQFLLKEGVISRVDIFKARLIQKRNNLRIGELAREKGWLTDEDIEKILSVQEETYEKFGEIAIYIVAESGFHHLGAFISRLESEKNLFLLSSIEIQTNSRNYLVQDIRFSLISTIRLTQHAQEPKQKPEI